MELLAHFLCLHLCFVSYLKKSASWEMVSPQWWRCGIVVVVAVCFRLEEIGAAAAKEHSLEKALKKMKSEWQDLCFEMVPYRDTVSPIHTLKHAWTSTGTCMHIHVHTDKIHTHIHIHTHTMYAYMHIHACTHTCIHT